jgi:hypothetical protein
VTRRPTARSGSSHGPSNPARSPRSFIRLYDSSDAITTSTSDNPACIGTNIRPVTCLRPHNVVRDFGSVRDRFATPSTREPSRTTAWLPLRTPASPQKWSRLNRMLPALAAYGSGRPGLSGKVSFSHTGTLSEGTGQAEPAEAEEAVAR